MNKTNYLQNDDKNLVIVKLEVDLIWFKFYKEWFLPMLCDANWSTLYLGQNINFRQLNISRAAYFVCY